MRLRAAGKDAGAGVVGSPASEPLAFRARSGVAVPELIASLAFAMAPVCSEKAEHGALEALRTHASQMHTTAIISN